MANITGTVTNFENVIGGEVTWVMLAADMMLIYPRENAPSKEQPEPVRIAGLDIYGTFIVCGVDRCGTLCDIPVPLADFKRFWLGKEKQK